MKKTNCRLIKIITNKIKSSLHFICENELHGDLAGTEFFLEKIFKSIFRNVSELNKLRCRIDSEEQIKRI